MKISRIIRFLLVAMMMAVTSISKAFTVDGIIYYGYDDHTAAVIHCANADTVRIPPHVIYDGVTYKVTSLRCLFNTYNEGYAPNNIVHVSLPSTIKTIEDEAFKDSRRLRSVELGDSIISIGNSAFENCMILEDFKMPNTVTSIGQRAFANCWHLNHLDLTSTSISEIKEETFSACMRLESIDIPSSVTTIGRDAFSAARLKHVSLPNGVITIGYAAFSNCDSLKSVTLPKTLTTISGAAFADCVQLEGLLIPRGVNSITPDIITGCDNLRWLVVDSENTTYDSRENCNAIILSSENKLIQGSPVTIIPEGVTAIGDYAFWGINIPKTFTIPNSIQTIGNKAFTGINFVNVILPKSIRWIGEESFQHCITLTSLTLPSSLEHIGDKAFYDCQELRMVISCSTDPIAINENVFETVSRDKIYQNAVLHVPEGCAEKYRIADGWKRFSQILGDVIVNIPGDVNGDGEVTVADANSAIQIIINGGANGGHTRVPNTDGQFIIPADVNGDGEVNIADVNAIIDYILRNE